MDLHENAVAYLNETDRKKNLELAELLYNEIKKYLKKRFQKSVPESLMDDILQDTLIAIFEKLEEYEGKTEGVFKAWCKQFFFFKKCDMWRAKYAARTVVTDPDALNEEIDKSEQIKPFLPGEKPDLDDAMLLFKKLEPDCLELLCKKADGMKLYEIAREMSLKTDAVRMRIKRCAEKASKWLTKKKK